VIALTAQEIAEAVGGSLVGSAAPNWPPDPGSVVTDSRLARAGSIFIALPGTIADGHDFVGAAALGGAWLAIVERPVDAEILQIVVGSSVTALAALAREVVRRVRDHGTLQVIAVTGSNGKTTTKNMLRTILQGEGPTVAPRDSLNNDVGAPISMLAIDEHTRFLIVEMGADAPGDVARLVSIVTPDVAIVLNVGLAHVEKFGSQDAIEQAKSEMVTDLPATATAVLNFDDPRVRHMSARTRASVLWFGLDAAASIRATSIRSNADSTVFTLHVGPTTSGVSLRLLGEHQVMNALAAVAASSVVGVPADRAVRAIEGMTRAERWRMEVLPGPDGVTIINDAYNASPDSMAAALKTLAEITRGGGRSVAVLGEMAELGELALEEHDRIGRLVVRLNIQQLFVVGYGARHIHSAAALEGSWDGESVLVSTSEEAYAVLREQLRPGDVVLVKSSNSAGLRFLGDRLAGIPA